MLMLLFSAAPRTDLYAEGRVISATTYQGVIFTPRMVHSLSEICDYANPGEDEKVAFWTPSAALIAKAERTLSSRLEEIQKDVPADGFHFREFYTPKYSSRDRNPPPSAFVYTGECVWLEEWMDMLKSSHQRQYIGITVNGEKALLLNFFWSNTEGKTWKSTWRKNWPYFYYLIEKDKFAEPSFLGEMEDG
jgi:hypothetical protein